MKRKVKVVGVKGRRSAMASLLSKPPRLASEDWLKFKIPELDRRVDRLRKRAEALREKLSAIIENIMPECWSSDPVVNRLMRRTTSLEDIMERCIGYSLDHGCNHGKASLALRTLARLQALNEKYNMLSWLAVAKSSDRLVAEHSRRKRRSRKLRSGKVACDCGHERRKRA